MTKFRGVFANLPTPFDSTGEHLDLNALDRLLDFVLEHHVHGVACLLSSGEYPYLEQEERKRVAQEVVRRIDKRIPVIVGVSAMTTKEAKVLTVHADGIGADGVIVMPIQYWPLRADEVVSHFESISRVTSLPLGIYDNPRLGGAHITAELYRTLMDRANVCFSKDSSGAIVRVAEVVHACGTEFSILHGNHMEMLPAYILGATGVCTAMASFVPDACVELYELSVVKHDWDAARRKFDELGPLFRFCHSHSLSRCTKEASEILGRPLGPQRRPLSGLTGEDRGALTRLLDECGYLPNKANSRKRVSA